MQTSTGDPIRRRNYIYDQLIHYSGLRARAAEAWCRSDYGPPATRRRYRLRLEQGCETGAEETCTAPCVVRRMTRILPPKRDAGHAIRGQDRAWTTGSVAGVAEDRATTSARDCMETLSALTATAQTFGPQHFISIFRREAHSWAFDRARWGRRRVIEHKGLSCQSTASLSSLNTCSTAPHDSRW